MLQGNVAKTNLVVCRAGDNSLHKEWLEPIEYKNFDLLIDYYGDEHNKYAADAEIYLETKGPKWPQIYNLIASMQEQIMQYEAIWFPDDDLSVDCKTINKMFELFHSDCLSLAQPALTLNSYITHPITVRNSKFVLRFTNFVEVMAPVFSREALMLCWNSFNESNSGWGLDFIWPKLLADKQIAIIDETPVRHTRPIGGGNLYKVVKTHPYEEMLQISKTYGIKQPYSFRAFGGLAEQPQGQYKYIPPGMELNYRLACGAPMNLINNKSYRNYLLRSFRIF